MWGPITETWWTACATFWRRVRRTCTADETSTVEYVGINTIGEFESGKIHYMECSECGHTYEHVNGDYEFCPRCGKPRRDVEE